MEKCDDCSTGEKKEYSQELKLTSNPKENLKRKRKRKTRCGEKSSSMSMFRMSLKDIADLSMRINRLCFLEKRQVLAIIQLKEQLFRHLSAIFESPIPSISLSPSTSARTSAQVPKEVEIDLKELKMSTLRKIKRFVDSCPSRKKSRVDSGHKNSLSSASSRSISDTETETETQTDTSRTSTSTLSDFSDEDKDKDNNNNKELNSNA